MAWFMGAFGLAEFVPAPSQMHLKQSQSVLRFTMGYADVNLSRICPIGTSVYMGVVKVVRQKGVIHAD